MHHSDTLREAEPLGPTQNHGVCAAAGPVQTQTELWFWKEGENIQPQTEEFYWTSGPGCCRHRTQERFWSIRTLTGSWFCSRAYSSPHSEPLTRSNQEQDFWVEVLEEPIETEPHRVEPGRIRTIRTRIQTPTGFYQNVPLGVMMVLTRWTIQNLLGLTASWFLTNQSAACRETRPLYQ